MWQPASGQVVSDEASDKSQREARSTDTSAEKDLVGIKGWLLLYAIKFVLGTAVLLLSMVWGEMSDVEGRVIGIFLLIGVWVGLYLLIEVRRPFTRYYHIGLNVFFAAIFALEAILTPALVFGLANCTENSIWTAYWIRSKRVRATYCHDAADLESP